MRLSGGKSYGNHDARIPRKNSGCDSLKIVQQILPKYCEHYFWHGESCRMSTFYCVDGFCLVQWIVVRHYETGSLEFDLFASMIFFLFIEGNSQPDEV